MSTIRRAGGLLWDGGGHQYTTRHAGQQWVLVKHLRRDGHVGRNGWYLAGPGVDDWVQAGSRIEYAVKVATVLVLGKWDRTALRDPDGTPTWRNLETGEVRREPEVLAVLNEDADA